MSNARYFAQGTDYWRVLYDNDTVEGPYTSVVMARRIGNTGIKVRESWRGWGESRFLHSTYQLHQSYKLQKLSPVHRECDLKPGCIPSLCLGGHGMTLAWLDVEE